MTPEVTGCKFECTNAACGARRFVGLDDLKLGQPKCNKCRSLMTQMRREPMPRR